MAFSGNSPTECAAPLPGRFPFPDMDEVLRLELNRAPNYAGLRIPSYIIGWGFTYDTAKSLQTCVVSGREARSDVGAHQVARQTEPEILHASFIAMNAVAG